MAKILQFTQQVSSKLGFERVKKRKGPEKNQLNLFSSGSKRILNLPSNLSPFEEALLLDERGDQRAADAYWKAISEEDSMADAYCNLGILESKAGRTTKAFDSFTKALKHDPRHFESHYNLGNLYLEVGDFRLARTHYQLAAEIEPSFPNVYFNLGLVHAINEDFGAAVEALDKFKELVPKDEGDKADGFLLSLKQSLAHKGKN